MDTPMKETLNAPMVTNIEAVHSYNPLASLFLSLSLCFRVHGSHLTAASVKCEYELHKSSAGSHVVFNTGRNSPTPIRTQTVGKNLLKELQ